MRRSQLVVAAMVAAVCVAASSAQAAPTTSWYWDSGFCKSQLVTYQMQLGPGSLLSTASAYCIGLHNRCWLHNGDHEFKDFKVFILSRDGSVRTFHLNVTGKYSWVGTPFRLLARGRTKTQFAAKYSPIAHADAARENAQPCTDPTYNGSTSTTR